MAAHGARPRYLLIGRKAPRGRIRSRPLALCPDGALGAGADVGGTAVRRQARCSDPTFDDALGRRRRGDGRASRWGRRLRRTALRPCAHRRPLPVELIPGRSIRASILRRKFIALDITQGITMPRRRSMKGPSIFAHPLRYWHELRPCPKLGTKLVRASAEAGRPLTAGPTERTRQQSRCPWGADFRATGGGFFLAGRSGPTTREQRHTAEGRRQ